MCGLLELAIAAGTVWGGWKIIETMGLRITTLRASSGLAANIGAVTAIFGATGMGIPISTTHAAASSIIGSGVASGQGVNLRVVVRMLASWVITIPSTIVVRWVTYQLTELPGAAAWISVGSVLFVLVGWIAWAMARALHAPDVAAEIPLKRSFANRCWRSPTCANHASRWASSSASSLVSCSCSGTMSGSATTVTTRPPA
jgi:PiT family inorganic phosphate transporter